MLTAKRAGARVDCPTAAQQRAVLAHSEVAIASGTSAKK